MITFFTTCKPFRGHDGIIQRNALKSWTLLHPDVEVIVFGDEFGVAEVCAEFGLRHEPKVERYESKLPYVDGMFARAQKVARHAYLCYANCDIILFRDFLEAFEKAIAWKKRLLMVGQRWDLDVTELIDFAGLDWAKELHRLAVTAGHLQIPAFMDFFLFPRGLYDSVPRLVVGYAYWDHWMVWKALSAGYPVLDATACIVPVHQNHAYNTTPERNKGSHTDATAMRNFEVSGRGKHLRSMIHSTYRMHANGKIRRTPFRWLFENASVLSLRQILVEKTFPLRDHLGLRRRKQGKTLGGTLN